MASAASPAMCQALQELKRAREESDRLFAILKSQALYERPIDARHRVIFYLGHLDGFDFIQICREALDVPSFSRTFDDLFQAGIDPDPNSLPTDAPADWPTLPQVQEYVRGCRAQVDQHLDRAPADVIHMALEHRLMHLETLAYMFHNFDYSAKLPVQQTHRTDGRAALNSWVLIPAGSAILGKAQDGVFGWDNEYKETRAEVPEFRIEERGITNGDYLAFVKAGAKHPHFWVERGGELFYRGMFEEIPLPLDWPVWVTNTEARAYADWIGARLPTEEEYHRAAYGDSHRTYPWGENRPSFERGNFDFKRWDPEPVTATPAGDTPSGLRQLVGNGWQWTRTTFSPFPGFEARATYPGYSANFFDGQHYVLKGGSPRTAARLLRPSFRNWFRGDYPYVYATFRCVRED